MKPRFLIHRETDWTTDEIVRNFNTSLNVTSTVDVSSAYSEIQSSENIQDDNTRDDEGLEVPIMLQDFDSKQFKLLSGLFPKTKFDKASNSGGGSKNNRDNKTVQIKCKEKCPSSSKKNINITVTKKLKPVDENSEGFAEEASSIEVDGEVQTEMWMKQVGSWYESFTTNYSVGTPEKDAEYDDPLIYCQTLDEIDECKNFTPRRTSRSHDIQKYQNNNVNFKSQYTRPSKNVDPSFNNISSSVDNWSYSETDSSINKPLTSNNHMKRRSIHNNQKRKEVCCYDYKNVNYQNDYCTTEIPDKYNRSFEYVYDDDLTEARKQYRTSVGYNLVAPRLSINPKNVRSMTISKPVSVDNDNDTNKLITDTNQNNCYNKCDDDIRTMEKHNNPVRTSTPEPLQVSTVIKESGNDVVYDICYGSQPNNFNNLKEETQQETNNNEQEAVKICQEALLPSARNIEVEVKPMCSYNKEIELADFQVAQTNPEDLSNENAMFDAFRYKEKNCSFEAENDFELVDLSSKQIKADSSQVDLKESSSDRRQQDNLRYFAYQQKLFHIFEIINVDISDKEHSFTFLDDKKHKVQTYLSTNQTVAEPVDVKEVNLDNSEVISTETDPIQPPNVKEFSNAQVESPKDTIQISTSEEVNNEIIVIPELPNNTCLFLTLPEQASATVQLQMGNNLVAEEKSKRKKNKSVNSKNKNTMKNTALRALLLEKLFKVLGKGTDANNEVGLPNN